jgi:glycosyltransferase involved in cell wall biosynthesis
MLAGQRVAAIVPCHNEARFIRHVLESLPDEIDDIIVVDDASRDGTADVVVRSGQTRAHVLRLERCSGVGAAIVVGYRQGLALGAELMLVTNGDGQMNGHEALDLLRPLVEGRADLVKGNRLLCPMSRGDIPALRRAGIEFFSALTRAATGYWHVGDSQSGYHAITAAALRRLPLDKLWPSYGFPNDLLMCASRAGLRVRDCPVRAIYGKETSGLRPKHVVAIVGLLGRGLVARWTGLGRESP